jgi:hypothetical protein
MNTWFKGNLCALFPPEAAPTSGPWRLSYFYKYAKGRVSLNLQYAYRLMTHSDTVGARALPHNAVDLHPPLKRGNLTLEACVNACSAAGL